jgi:menaquinone-dependent protoporphyrinogen oxidase
MDVPLFSRKGGWAMKQLTRREFISCSVKLGGTAIGTIALMTGLPMPEISGAETVMFPESKCGIEERNKHRVLVAYASRCGSTGGVAEAIGQTLCNNGVAVDVRLVEKVKDLSPYQSIVVGSAIRRSKWLPEAMEFVEVNREFLKEVPVAYFLTCLTLSRSTKETRLKAKAYLDPVCKAVPQVQPLNTGLFAGVLDYSKLSWGMRMVMRRKMDKFGVKEGDYRDWDAIRTWTSLVRSSLLPG